MMEKEKGIELTSDKGKEQFGAHAKNKARAGGLNNPQSANGGRGDSKNND